MKSAGDLLAREAPGCGTQSLITGLWSLVYSNALVTGLWSLVSGFWFLV